MLEINIIFDSEWEGSLDELLAEGEVWISSSPENDTKIQVIREGKAENSARLTTFSLGVEGIDGLLIILIDAVGHYEGPLKVKMHGVKPTDFVNKEINEALAIEAEFFESGDCFGFTYHS